MPSKRSSTGYIPSESACSVCTPAALTRAPDLPYMQALAQIMLYLMQCNGALLPARSQPPWRRPPPTAKHSSAGRQLSIPLLQRAPRALFPKNPARKAGRSLR